MELNTIQLVIHQTMAVMVDSVLILVVLGEILPRQLELMVNQLPIILVVHMVIELEVDTMVMVVVVL